LFTAGNTNTQHAGGSAEYANMLAKLYSTYDCHCWQSTTENSPF